jgi:hypothetical protein
VQGRGRRICLDVNMTLELDEGLDAGGFKRQRCSMKRGPAEPSRVIDRMWVDWLIGLWFMIYDLGFNCSCACVCVFARAYTPTYTPTYLPTYIHTYMHTHTHTHA